MTESEADETEPQVAHGPLEGLRVLELGEMVAAPYCAKLLGDLGADVIKVERPEHGDPSRWRGPFSGDQPNPERSGLFLYLNTSKRSVCLDLALPQDRDAFEALASRSDILIEDRAPEALDALGLGYASLAARNPRLIVTSISPFGQTGPNRGHKSHPINLFHSAGHSSPFASLETAGGRAPARAGGHLGEYDAGLMAAVGTLGAVFGREITGRGQHIDVSKQEAMMGLERVTIGRFANEANPFPGGGIGGLIRAKDGWVMLTTLENHQWEGLVRAMGNPAWTEAEWCKSLAGRVAHQQEIDEHRSEWASTRTREEIYHLVQQEGTPAAPVRNVAEVMQSEQSRSRGFFRELDHPEAGRVTFPTAPYQFSRTAWVGTRAPLLGEHSDEILTGLGRPQPAGDAKAAAGMQPSGVGSGGARGPLDGIRIADFTWAWAGPQGSLLLGMLGAEVIKIESRARPDHARVHSLTAGGLRGGIDESPIFNDLNLGKRSVTLNLRSDAGRGLVRKLVAECDVVLQNMRPGVLDRLELGYDDLRKVNPEIVMLSSSTVGATGPERRYVGYAPTFACLSGIASISGYPDEPPMPLSGSVDLRVGTASAFAVLAALIHRQRKGEGQNIDLSSTEVMSTMMGHAFVGYGLDGRIPERIGNRDEQMAPHGCYRCRSEGEWVTIAVETEEEWNAFRSLLADPQLDAAMFATAQSRHRNQEPLDARIEHWTQGRSAEDVVQELQTAGIAAARLNSGASLSRDRHVLARQVFQSIEHPRLGSLQVLRPPWRMEGAKLNQPSPLLGQHNRDVLGTLLGLDDQEISQLMEDEAVY
ncbi:MAG: CoA transferase [bacterium]|nr:CoA transferase [bacterium]